MEFELWSSIIQVFLKSDSMEIFKSAQNLCQFDGRICRFSSSKLIHGGLQPKSEDFSVYNLNSKRSKFAPPWKCVTKGEFSTSKNGWWEDHIEISFFFPSQRKKKCVKLILHQGKRTVLWVCACACACTASPHRPIKHRLGGWPERCQGIFLHEAKSIWANLSKTFVGNLGKVDERQGWRRETIQGSSLEVIP